MCICIYVVMHSIAFCALRTSPPPAAPLPAGVPYNLAVMSTLTSVDGAPQVPGQGQTISTTVDPASARGRPSNIERITFPPPPFSDIYYQPPPCTTTHYPSPLPKTINYLFSPLTTTHHYLSSFPVMDSQGNDLI